MKIGLVLPYNVVLGGGVKEIVFAQKDELQKRGHEVYIITPQPRDAELTTDDKDIIYVGKGTDFNSPLHTTSQVSAGINESIDEMLDRHQFDVLHFHEPWVPMLSAQILSRSKCVNVATFHAKLPETLMTRTIIKVVTPYTKSVLKYIDAFTAVSPAAAEYVCSLTDKPVALIPNGIDLNRYKAPARRTDNKKQKTIFYVGRLEPRKGVSHLLHAFKILSEGNPNASLIIAGDGPDRAKLEAMVGDQNIPNVVFAGFISDKEKIHYLRTADLYCSPALYGESFGIVLLEAMASGLVTVAGDNPGYASVMNGLGAISLVNPKHHAEFARRLNLLLQENDLRSLWRQWAAEQIPQYSYSSVVAQYEEIYKKAIRDRANEPKD
jgi:phosphatidylinositol alpha-mannosyltransferase